MAGVTGPTPHGIRVGPVYTPPADRGHGFASAVTAAASQGPARRGRRFVFLFTDLSNPTSNKIYQAIGYEPVIDIDQWSFEIDRRVAPIVDLDAKSEIGPFERPYRQKPAVPFSSRGRGPGRTPS